MKLRVIGKLDEELIKKYEKVLKYGNSKKRIEIILFCDFSEFEIPIDYKFTSVENMEGKIILINGMILKNVSQEYIMSFDLIPLGWRTICKFQLLEKSSGKLLDQLPTIKHWSESSTFFILK